MKKVLLIFEDYAESAKTQTYLKRVGFDVLLQNHDQRIADQVVTFNPDVIIVCGMQKFSSLDVGIKLKAMSNLRAKTILILPQGKRPNPMELTKARVDILVEAPVAPEKLIQLIAKITNIDPNNILEKYKKAKISEENTEHTMVGSSKVIQEKIHLNDPARTEKYSQFIQEIQFDLSQTSHSKQAIRLRQNELKKGWDFKMLEEIDKLKRQFVQALFKK